METKFDRQRTEGGRRRTEDGRTVRQSDSDTVDRRTAILTTLAKAHGACRPGHGARATGHNGRPASTSEARATASGRSSERLHASTLPRSHAAGPLRATGHEPPCPPPCCGNCVFAVPLQDGSRELLVCTGCPQSPGRMKVANETDCCRAFRKRWQQSGRTVPPEPPDMSVRYIPLTKGKFAIVDAADYERVAKYKWYASGMGGRLYAARRQDDKAIYLHRFLTNAPKGMVVDHKDGNRLNDRQSNLRVCTQRQNIYNSPPRGKASRFKGVGWDKRHNKWVAGIRYYGRNIYLGLFQDEAEAARAYDRKAHELFGEYAYLNFPDEIKGHGRQTMT